MRARSAVMRSTAAEASAACRSRASTRAVASAARADASRRGAGWAKEKRERHTAHPHIRLSA
eukprot:4910597-Prymnesium_polylepis.1